MKKKRKKTNARRNKKEEKPRKDKKIEKKTKGKRKKRKTEGSNESKGRNKERVRGRKTPNRRSRNWEMALGDEIGGWE